MLTDTTIFRICLLTLSLCGLATTTSAQQIHSCTIITTAQPANSTAAQPSSIPPGMIQRAVSYKPSPSYGSNNWTTGGTVSVKFLGGSSQLQRRVFHYATEWTRYANVNFRVVTTGPADIRIAFEQNGASWSVVGRSSTYSDQNRASMNLGWLNDRTPDYEVKRTVLHEFGHALGLLHEHQNPAGGIPWNQEAVYEHYYRTQGWDRQTTYQNVMATASRDATQYTDYDQASIMHYPVSGQLTDGRYAVGMNNDLSAMDKRYIARMYPGRSTVTEPSTNPSVSAPTPAPARVNRYTVSINNQLGKDQESETVVLYLGERKFTFQLDRRSRTRQQFALELPAGEYQYRVVTESVYQGYYNVRRNGTIQKKLLRRTIPGEGSGTINIRESQTLALFGSYDKSRGRMQVELGVSK